MSGTQIINEMSSGESAKPFMDPNEIKQEPDIKEEPMETDDLVEFPVIINDTIIHQLDNPNLYIGEGDHVIVPLNEVKSEVKPECTEKKKKKKGLKPSGRNDARYNRNKPHSFERNAKKPTKLNAQGKAVKRHQCDQCGYATTVKANLERHLVTHTGEKPFPCSHCPKEFTRKQYLQNHMEMHVEEFLFNCAVCLKGFDEKNEKLEHEKECIIRRYECHLCKHSFGSNKTHLMNHIRVHSGTKPFECKECSKKFAQKGTLNIHMKTHFGPRSFHCSRCRLGFVQQNEMIAHEQKCSSRLYECYVCGKFIGLKKGNLVDHMHTHIDGDKPFQCDKCTKNFAQKGALNKHNEIHTRSLPCSVQFVTKDSRNKINAKRINEAAVDVVVNAACARSFWD